MIICCGPVCCQPCSNPPHAQDTLNDGKRRLRNVHGPVVDGLALGCLHLRSHLFPQWLVLVPLKVRPRLPFGSRHSPANTQLAQSAQRYTADSPSSRPAGPCSSLCNPNGGHRTIIRFTFLVVHKTLLGQLLLVVARQFRRSCRPPAVAGRNVSPGCPLRAFAMAWECRSHAAQFHARQVEARPVCRVRQHFRGLSAEVFFDPIDGGQRLGLFVGRRRSQRTI